MKNLILFFAGVGVGALMGFSTATMLQEASMCPKLLESGEYAVVNEYK